MCIMNSSDQSLSDELSQLEFTAGWPESLLAELAEISNYVEFADRSVIFAQGSENHQLYLICAGRVVLDMLVPARGPVRILTISRGELLAWSTLVGDGLMTATATVVEPVRAIAIDSIQLKLMCERRHDIGYEIMKRLATSLAHRLTATRLQLLDLYVHTTPHFFRPVEGID
ncbi:MAG: transcriptional activator FtrB [Planctomycetaceae bacterium]|nr:transcriptional activator FtrB [Planctomycetaceae bacterium]